MRRVQARMVALEFLSESPSHLKLHTPQQSRGLTQCLFNHLIDPLLTVSYSVEAQLWGITGGPDMRDFP